MPCMHRYSAQQDTDGNLEAVMAGVKLAQQRLTMYIEDATVANQVLKPPPKKRSKKDDAEDDQDLD